MVFDYHQLLADRANLRKLRNTHPDWSIGQLTRELGHCRNWVKKWLSRFAATPNPDDQTVLYNLPPVNRKPRPQPPALLLDRIEELRQTPPDNLKRIPGPRTLSYFLAKDEVLKQAGLTPPRSTATIHRLLCLLGLLARPLARSHRPVSRLAPFVCIATDFKDASTVTVEPDGKKQHVVEVLNMIDEGTSILWEAVVRSDFTAQTVVETFLDVFERLGLPAELRFDRDPRFVGASASRDFPSAFVRMLRVLGVTPHICPPHRPDKNGIVERYNGSFKRECLLVHRPENEAEVREVTTAYKEHYNHQRPHQGRPCGNQPPRVAFPELPALPSLPVMVDPDSWVMAVDKEHFTRKVRSDGAISVDKYDYYVGSAHADQYVLVRLDGPKRELVVLYKEKEIKRLAIKGLYKKAMSMEEYRPLIIEEARSEQRGWRPRPD
jgi:transposase InsO family protein